MDIIREILSNNDTWFQMFDMIRVIEPGGTHRVLSYCGKEDFDIGKPCYCFWDRSEHCANCVSKRAYNKQEPVLKLEFRNNKYYCVIAKPIELHDKCCLLELIMNISNQVNNDKEDDLIRDYMLDLTQRLETVSFTDAFTGLYNKAFLKVKYDDYVRDCNRGRIYMAILDMNNFKGINDNYGHDVGDKVLLNVANLLNSRFSNAGVVARFGGDEFCILFEGEEIEKCRTMLDKAKETIDKVCYDINGDTFCAGISYGIADVKDTEDFYEAIHMVDKIMYQAKHKEKE